MVIYKVSSAPCSILSRNQLFFVFSPTASDVLPQWLTAAMKCLIQCKSLFNNYSLAHASLLILFFLLLSFLPVPTYCFLGFVSGPNNEEMDKDSFPKYPGFERDVFRAVVEYFDNLVGPLVDGQLLSLFKKASGL